MRYLKRFNESIEELESKIKECFVGVSDMDVHIKLSSYLVNSKSSRLNGREVIIVKIGLDDRVTSGEEATSKWGVKYKPVINGKEIAFEISNAIQHCIGYDLDLNWANIRWKNAGEWNKPGKTGLGPGLLEKAFSKNGVTKQFENPDNGNYNLDDLCEFIESKGDMLRQVEIHFTEE
jgi:hypothetical protein